MNYRKIFKNNLKEIRETKGLSQAQLAKRGGFPPSLISHFETGTRVPSFENLIKLGFALNISVDYLIKGNMKNKLSKEDILNKIKKSTYTRLPSGKVTICEITLKNGFTVIGKSAVVDIENFNQQIGEPIAYENAIAQIWQVEGYLLQEKLYQAQNQDTTG